MSACSKSQQSKRGADCAGAEDFVSAYVDYHLTKRFDVYAGVTYSVVTGGMANGYAYAQDWAPTAGVRYSF